MADKTGIEWCDATWNCVRGCALVSQGCRSCYAMRVAHRFSGKGMPYEGLTKATSHGPTWTGTVRLVPELLTAPFRWVKGRRIFVNSMSDLFHEDVPFQFIADVFAVMSVTTRHTYQILTKRPQRMLEFFSWLTMHGEPASEWDQRFFFPEQVAPLRVWPQWTANHGHGGYDNCGPAWPCKNVWLGVSVENQETADERIPLLMQAPAAVRWISAEPLLGPINLAAWLPCIRIADFSIAPTLNWVVCGGESGANSRPMHPQWARWLRDQCVRTCVPFLFKQWGEWAPCPDDEWHGLGAIGKPPQLAIGPLGGNAGGFLSKALEEKRRSEGWMPIQRLGKKAAGRALDGRTWDEYPA